MNTNYKISIIVPLYNKSNYLIDCVNSVMQQDYPCYELLIIDDGSVDDGLKIANELRKKNDKIKVIHQKNQGVSVARNVGMNKSVGDWIMFLDPDDRLTENCLSTLVQHIKKDVDVVCGCCNVITDNSSLENQFFDRYREFGSLEEKRDLFLQLMDSQYGQPQRFYTAIGVPWGKLYRRKLLEDNNLLFDSSLKRAQDNIFNMYVFYYARTIIYINKPIYQYTYEHMGKYFDKYREDFKEIFCSIYKARRKCVEDIGILSDEIINNAYLSECCRQMVLIFKNAIFHKKCTKIYKEKKEKAIELYESGIFDNLLSLNNINFCESKKYRFLYYILRNKHFFVFNILSKIA